MNLPKLPANKISLGLVGIALVSGIVIGGANISRTVSVKNTSATDTSDPSVVPTPNDTITDPIVLQPETSSSPAPAASTSPTVQIAPSSAPDNTSTPSAAAQSATIAPAASAPAPVTMTSESKFTQSSADGNTTEFYCHRTFSDGSNTDVFAGAAPTSQYNAGQVGFACPSV